MANHGPPPGVPAESLVAYLMEKPWPSKVVDFPGDRADGTLWKKIRIRVPPASDHGAAQRVAHTRLRDQVKIPTAEWGTETGSSMLGDFTAKELLSRVIFSAAAKPGTEGSEDPQYARMFADGEQIEKALTSDEVAVLFGLFQQTMYELGPRLSILTDGEVDAWVEVLAEGLDPLAYLGLPDLHVLIRGLVRRIRANPQSSTSTSPDSPSSTWPDSSESDLPTSTTDISSSGEPQFPESIGSSVDTLTADDAAAIARHMAGK